MKLSPLAAGVFCAALMVAASGVAAQAEPGVPAKDERAPASVPELGRVRSSAEFVPSKHGFAFVNRFEGVPPLPKSLRDDRTTLGAIAKLIANQAGAEDSAYGLCGGMSAAAADWFLSRVDRPVAKEVPERGSPFFEYLVERQTDSLGIAGLMAVKFAEWMVLPDAADDFGGVEGRTGAELPRLVERLEAGELVPLGLVYNRVGESAIWDNHQVLAYRCERDGERVLRIWIYDPNWPGDDEAVIRVTLSVPLVKIAVDGASIAPVNRATSRQVGSRGRERTVRGFFAMPFAAKRIEAEKLDGSADAVPAAAVPEPTAQIGQ